MNHLLDSTSAGYAAPATLHETEASSRWTLLSMLAAAVLTVTVLAALAWISA